MANQECDIPNISAVDGGNYNYYWTAISPYDGPIPWSVTIDPDGVSGAAYPGNQIRRGVFEPVYPNAGIEYYDAILYDGRQNFFVDFEPGKGTINRFLAWFGVPTSEGFQEVISTTAPLRAHMVNTAPYGEPVWEWQEQTMVPNSISLSQSFRIKVSNSRVNPHRLRQVSWDDYAQLPDAITPYLNEESENRPHIEELRHFVTTILPETYRSEMTPYDTARHLYAAVIQRLNSKDANASQKNLLDCPRTDCGFYAIVYVSCLRAVGIPARIVSGCWANVDNGAGWHVWCEVFFPGYGWMMCDPNEAASFDKTGQYVARFGYIPNGNLRCAITHGGDHSMPYFQTRFLQPVNWIYSSPKVRAKTNTGETINQFQKVEDVR